MLLRGGLGGLRVGCSTFDERTDKKKKKWFYCWSDIVVYWPFKWIHRGGGESNDGILPHITPDQSLINKYILVLLLNLASTKKKKKNEPDILYCAMRPVWRHFIVIKKPRIHTKHPLVLCAKMLMLMLICQPANNSYASGQAAVSIN